MMAKVVRRIFSIALILLLPVLAMAQLPTQKKIDSLLVLAAKAKDDTSKINILNKLSGIYFTIDPADGIDFGNQALRLSEKTKWTKGIAKSYSALGTNYWAKYDFNRAQDYFGASLKISEEIGDKMQIAKSLHNIGICYEAQRLYPEAINYYKKSAILYCQSGQNDRFLGCLSNIAGDYQAQSKYANALDLFFQSIQLSRKLRNDRNIAFFSEKVSIVYLDMGNYNEALEYDKKALQIFLRLHNNEDIMTITANIGGIYLKRKDYQQAISQYKMAFKRLNEFTGRDAIATSANYYSAIGEAYFEWATDRNSGSQGLNKTGLLELAYENLQKAIIMDKSINYGDGVVGVLEALSNVQVAQGNYAGALKTYKEYVTDKDSLHGSEKEKEYTQHEVAFEYNKKRDSLNYINKIQNIELAKEKILTDSRLKQQSLYTLVIIVLSLLVASYFLYKNRIQKIRFNSELAKEKSDIQIKQIMFENKLNDLTLDSLKSQMNPHFIFNCLNSIKFYIEKNETKAASLYITKFSKLIRNILDSARSEKVMLADEVELVSLYLEMEHMRLKEKLFYEVEIAKNVDIEFIEIPPLLIQPYVENAIWHGLMNKAEGGSLKLSIKASPYEKYLIINITDNGIGRKKAAELKSKRDFQHVSHGIKLNNERIDIFNAKYKTNTEVIITDLYDATNKPGGTSVTIKLHI